MDDEATAYRDANSKRILLVEDELPFRQIYRDAMHNFGYNVLEAEDGKEGIKFVKIYKPDLVVLDLILPEVSGFDVLREIKSNPDLQHIPVIVYSVLEDKASVERAMKLGADDFTYKGITPATDVVTKIRNLLSPPLHTDEEAPADAS